MSLNHFVKTASLRRKMLMSACGYHNVAGACWSFKVLPLYMVVDDCYRASELCKMPFRIWSLI